MRDIPENQLLINRLVAREIERSNRTHEKGVISTITILTLNIKFQWQQLACGAESKMDEGYQFLT